MMKNSARKLLIVLFVLSCLVTTGVSFQTVAQENDFSETLEESKQISEKEYIQVLADSQDADYVGRDVATGNLHYFNVEVVGDSASTYESGVAEGMAPSYIPTNQQQISESFDLLDPYKIINSNDLKKVTPQRGVLPYAAIAVIEVKFPNGETGHGTAWMFYGDVAITAGHCVYNAEYGGWAKSIKLYAGPNGSATSATITANCSTMYTSNLWIESAQTKDDWGVLKLDTDVGAVTGYLGIYYTTGGMAGTSIEISGYPWDKNNDAYQFFQYKATGTITTSETAVLKYNVDTLGGQSGAPVFLANGGHVVGIHHGSVGSSIPLNEGARITPSLFDYLLSFRD